MSSDDFRSLLSSPSSPSLVPSLDRLFKDFSQRRYLLSSIFYPYFSDLCDRLFVSSDHRPSLLRSDSRVFSLLRPGGSFFELLFRSVSFPPRFQCPAQLLPAPLVREIKFQQTRRSTAANSGATPSASNSAISALSPLSALYWPLYRPGVDKLELSIHEYYFLYFANYLVSHESQESLVAVHQPANGKRNGHQTGAEITAEESQNRYCQLMMEYCEYFIPFAAGHNAASGSVSGAAKGSSAAAGKDHSRGSQAPSNVYSAAFVSICSQVWLGQNAYRPFNQFCKTFNSSSGMASSVSGAAAAAPTSPAASTVPSYSTSLDLRYPVSLSSVDRKSLSSSIFSSPEDLHFHLPSKHLLLGINKFIHYLLLDPSLADTPTHSIIALYHVDWLLFTFLRVCFLRWSNEWDTRLMYLVDLWGFILQPWKIQGENGDNQANTNTNSATNQPDATDKYKYNPIWRSYVLRESPFYTVLFSDFLCLLGDLDLGREGGKTRNANLRQLYSLIAIFQTEALVTLLSDLEIQCNPLLQWHYQHHQRLHGHSLSHSNANSSINFQRSNRRLFNGKSSSNALSLSSASIHAPGSSVSQSEIQEFRSRLFAMSAVPPEQYIPVFFDSNTLIQELGHPQQQPRANTWANQSGSQSLVLASSASQSFSGPSASPHAVEFASDCLRESSSTAQEVIRLLTPTGVRDAAALATRPDELAETQARLKKEEEMWADIQVALANILHLEGGAAAVNNQAEKSSLATPAAAIRHRQNINSATSASAPGSASFFAFATPDRDPNDPMRRLTAGGRSQLRQGQRICLPTEPVPLRGDIWDRPARSDEFASLLPVARWLTDRFQRSASGWMGKPVNLSFRFVASHRFALLVIVFMIIIWFAKGQPQQGQ